MMKEIEIHCPICHVGKLQLKKAIYSQVFQDRLIVVPNVSALVCDVCGERMLDNQILSRLSGLLAPGRPDGRPVTRRI